MQAPVHLQAQDGFGVVLHRESCQGRLGCTWRDSTRNWTSMVLFLSLSTRIGKPARGGARPGAHCGAHSDIFTHIHNHTFVYDQMVILLAHIFVLDALIRFTHILAHFSTYTHIHIHTRTHTHTHLHSYTISQELIDTPVFTHLHVCAHTLIHALTPDAG